MIGTSPLDWWIIWISATFLRYGVLSTAVFCFVARNAEPFPYEIPRLIIWWSYAEILFCPCYWAWTRHLQFDARHPALLPQEKRLKLFQLCQDTIRDPELYLRQWFKGAKIEEIRLGNVKELYSWAMLSQRSGDTENDTELEYYVLKTEQLLGRKFGLGYGTAQPLTLTLDPILTAYRPCLWYICVFFVDSAAHAKMLLRGFVLYRNNVLDLLLQFPMRVSALTSSRISSGKRYSYYYRPHTAQHRLPLVFIHGIGIGLYPYVDFLAQINAHEPNDDVVGEIGIIAIEVMPISFRISKPMPTETQTCAEILNILQRHGWSRAILVSHSFGSVICSHLLHNELTASVFGPLVLIDPVSVLLHHPDVAYNFIHRLPRRANEMQLNYFASTDPGVAHTLGRHFFWQQNVLWREELANRQVTICLAEKDLIVNTQEVAQYISDNYEDAGQDWRRRRWTGRGIEILWFEKIDHAQVFDRAMSRRKIVDVIRSYSKGVSEINP